MMMVAMAVATIAAGPVTVVTPRDPITIVATNNRALQKGADLNISPPFIYMIYRYILDLIDDGLIRKGKVLDLGCGYGTASTLLSSLGFEIEAVDIKEFEITTPKEGGTIIFTKSDIRNFPIRKNSYDFIHGRNILHFLNKEEVRLAIRRMYAGLKKGGVMYFNLSGDKDGWRDRSKNVTFMNNAELTKYAESQIVGKIHCKVTRLGYSTTTSGIYKFSHTIAYTVIKN